MPNRLHKLVKPAKKAAKQKPVPVKIVADKANAVNPIDDQKWRACSDLSTLQLAAEIHKDKARLKAAKAEAKSQMKMLSGVCK